jgi:hypothetical protein
MSDNQRRAIFRVIFLITCFLPTGVVGYWICHPQTADGWERAIQAELGITTQIDSVFTPGPNVTILTGVEFTDPDGTLLFKTVEAKIEFGGEKENRVVIPYKVEHLSSQGLDYLVNTIKDKAIRKDSTQTPWRIVFEADTKIEQTMFADLKSSSDRSDSSIVPLEFVSSLNISDLNIYLGPNASENGTFAQASFYVDDNNALAGNLDGESLAERTPVICELARTEQNGTLVALDSKGNALPCWLLANSAEMLRPLGSKATFNGEIAIEKTTPSQQRLKVTGEFRDVDLGRSGLARANAYGDRPSLARIEVIQCAYDRHENTAWNVVLFTDQNSTLPGTHIRESDLFYESKQINIAHALERTLLPLARNAATDANYK